MKLWIIRLMVTSFLSQRLQSREKSRMYCILHRYAFLSLSIIPTCVLSKTTALGDGHALIPDFLHCFPPIANLLTLILVNLEFV